MVYVPGLQNRAPFKFEVNVGAGEVKVNVIGTVDVDAPGENATHVVPHEIALGVNTVV
jgi:mRNA-degrading endonuclease toxin of MazEF toxin-antitoxin module